MKDLGLLTWFLGIQLVHDEGTIKMNQTLSNKVVGKIQHGELQTLVNTV